MGILKIGVTGGIGSGKSLVCSMFQEKGAPVLSADQIAKELSNKNVEIREKINQEFGSAAYETPDHSLNRQYIASVVFKDFKKLALLNSIIHPIVLREIERVSKDIKKDTHCKYILIEAALIFESRLDKKLDYVLAVIADETLRTNRIMKRDGIAEQDVRARMNQQLDDEQLRSKSDFIIINDGSVDDLRNRIDFFHSLFETLASSNHG